MTIRTGFTHHSSTTEQSLVQNLVTEAIQVAGFDVNYLPRTSNNIDTIFDDAEKNSFTTSYAIEMYFGQDTIQGFGGGGDVLGRFGYEVQDACQLVCSMSRFTAIVTAGDATITRPREGDLIYLPFSSQLYEITFSEDQVPFFQLGKNYIWQMECSLFRYAQDTLDTGISAIDDIATATDQFTQSTDIETAADGGIVDFTETNPFGTY
ncbi:hypothetical protein CL614_07685 [archaeon]|nr:hypothetical protein [archaeon]|tara:strand:+ start:1237 stop:1860 length:624 start_codon:yes stop_codon:yes gene_type:complete